MLFSKRQESPSAGAPEWLIAGLGNPGPKYVGTRHNTGWSALDVLAERHAISVSRSRFQGLTGTGEIAGQRVLLLKPATFMNLSGRAVAEAAKFYHIPPEHIIVLSDDISLPTGQIRVRGKGSAGGHNGLKSIIASLGSENFPRVKVGVGAKPHPDYDLAAWVLSRFTGEDLAVMQEAYERAADAVEWILREGVESAQNHCNKKALSH